LDGVRVGDEGVADSPLRPAGRVRFDDRYADVVADSYVESGRPVRVIKISGNRIVVREV
jgi:membrane-bound serine protease (ClpP class)